MKTLFTALATSLTLLGSTATFAASTVDLTVKGMIVPSACTPTLSSGGIVDIGKISAKDLLADDYTLVGTHMMTLAVICDGAIPFALAPIDNRAGSAPMLEDFGLGFINGTQKLGGFMLKLQNLVADGSQVQGIVSRDAGNTWYNESFLSQDYYTSVTSLGGAAQPLPVKELTADLRVMTYINRADVLDLNNEVPLDGSATLEVKYL